jgi:hypothetical protein
MVERDLSSVAAWRVAEWAARAGRARAKMLVVFLGAAGALMVR